MYLCVTLPERDKKCGSFTVPTTYRQDNVWQVLAFPFRFSAHPLPLFAHWVKLSTPWVSPDRYVSRMPRSLSNQIPLTERDLSKQDAGAAKSAAHLNKMHHASLIQMQLVTRTLDRCPLNERLPSSIWWSIPVVSPLAGRHTDSRITFVGFTILRLCHYSTRWVSRINDTVSTWLRKLSNAPFFVLQF
jgi:hypothetical protein